MNIFRNHFPPLFTFVFGYGLSAAVALAAPVLDHATKSINSLGLELLRTTELGNTLFSPYSIQSALAMTYAGASGLTREEMQRALHYPADEELLHASFAELRRSMEKITASTKAAVERSGSHGGPKSPVIMKMANGLFGEASFRFNEPFLSLSRDQYAASFQPMDFINGSDASCEAINSWVDKATEGRIGKVLAPGSVGADTKLLLVNTVYLKAPWQTGFKANQTKPEKFALTGGKSVKVPTMFRSGSFGFSKRQDFRVVAIPYLGGDLRFVVLLPDQAKGLSTLEKRLTPELLTGLTNLSETLVELHLPKFRLEPSGLPLAGKLKSLGMKSAFNIPPGSADFARLAPKEDGRALELSEVFHRAFLNLDESGTEAAAATIVRLFMFGSDAPPPKPIEVRVDHPFLFAIQHVPSGTCLFLGRVTDPR